MSVHVNDRNNKIGENINGYTAEQYHQSSGDDGINVICSLYDGEKTVNVQF